MSKRTCHEICFLDVSNDWDSALPVGNGRLGAMVFLKGRVLHIAMNHYDCYYRVLPGPNGKKDKSGQTFQDPARFVETYEELCRKADAVRMEEGVERSHYGRTLHPVQNAGRPSYRGASYPVGGEVLLTLGDEVDTAHSSLKLRIEEAVITLEAGSGDARVSARILASAGRDGVLLELSQTRDGLWEKVGMIIPDSTGMEAHSVQYHQDGWELCMRTVYGEKLEDWFAQELALCVSGGESSGREKAVCEASESEMSGANGDRSAVNANISQETMSLCGMGRRFWAAVSLQPEITESGKGTESEAPKAAEAGLAEVGKAETVNCHEAGKAEGLYCHEAGKAEPLYCHKLGKARRLARLMAREADLEVSLHEERWQQFWSGTVRLPDAFLERLWHLHLYLMECACGRGSSYPEHACGLSGLWDIRRPNQWGSMWYWDVNIESAFWGAGAAGHPELLKLFCDGYLAYEQDIREYTRKVYGKEGWALDYPHPLYHCIQPWCAQFLWEYYQYSQDLKFLEDKAYPVFREQINFFKELSQKDECGIRHMEYDISPEQGPVTKDSVITISCIRRLIRMALQAGEILKRPFDEMRSMEELLGELPQYPLTADKSRYKDSALVQDNIFLRHPSLLMPLFPANEEGMDSDEETLKRWERTLAYAGEHTETGTFGMGWLAAAAARLGRGTSALRLIYEKGLDYILHSNGLAYEESERFLNYCHVTKPANYLPAMCETSGGLVNAVNQMLLQTGKNGEIKVFPAMPGDTPDLLEKVVQYREDDLEAEGTYAAWKDAGFTGLLAPGGLRVSAERREGRTVYLKVESTMDCVLKLLLPGELSKDRRDKIVEQNMKAGEVLWWGQEKEMDTEACNEQETEAPREHTAGGVLCHVAARTNRRIFLGADQNTSYYRAVDAFTCGYLLANELRYVQTPYIFDFGTQEAEKDYNNSYPKQFVASGRCILYAAAPRRLGVNEYRPDTGWGFLTQGDSRTVDRGKPDDLRRDFVEGQNEVVFVMNLPKGKYDFLLICGDEEEASLTQAALPQHGTKVSTGTLAAGQYGCRILPVVHENDGELFIQLSTKEGYKWKLNAMFINKEFALCNEV